LAELLLNSAKNLRCELCQTSSLTATTTSRELFRFFHPHLQSVTTTTSWDGVTNTNDLVTASSCCGMFRTMRCVLLNLVLREVAREKSTRSPWKVVR